MALNTMLLDSSPLSGAHLLVWCEGDLAVHYQHRQVALEPFIPEVARQWEVLHNAADTRLMVCIGPGSYTGVRAGRALMQGLARGSGRPLLEVSSFALLKAADKYAAPDSRYGAAIDRGRWQCEDGTITQEEKAAGLAVFDAENTAQATMMRCLQRQNIDISVLML